MTKYDLLLFDLDETLLDFGAAERYAFTNLLKTFNLLDDDALFTAYDEINKATWAEYEKKLITADQIKVLRFERFINRFDLPFDPYEMSAEYLKRLSEDHTEIPGAFELIPALAADFRLGLITNGLTQVQWPRVKNSGLEPFFEHIFISEEIGLSKPSSALFQMVVDTFAHTDLSRTMIIGDSLTSDIKGGIDFGIHTCWFNPKRISPTLQPTYTITGLPELPPIVYAE